jgi:hypothetical protein
LLLDVKGTKSMFMTRIYVKNVALDCAYGRMVWSSSKRPHTQQHNMGYAFYNIFVISWWVALMDQKAEVPDE